MCSRKYLLIITGLLIVSLMLSACDDDSSVVGPRADPALDAKTTILLIYSGISQYSHDNGQHPESIAEIEDGGYVSIGSTIQKEWKFYLILNSWWRHPSVNYIQAVSTVEMKDGAGKVLMYDIESGLFSGYGVDEVTSGDVKVAFGSIFLATKAFEADSSREPGSFDELIEAGYNSLANNLPSGWSFSYWGNEPIVFIRAIRNGTYSWDSTSVEMQTFYIPSGRYTDYGQIDHSLPVVNTLADIYFGIIAHRQDDEHGEEPNTITEMLEEGYLIIDEEIDRTWHFTLFGANPITVIEAVSNNEYYDGAGHTVYFDIRYGIFFGYGLPEDYPHW